VAACSASSPPVSSGPGAGAGGPADSGTCPQAVSPGNLSGWNSSTKSTGLIPQIVSSEQVCGRNRLLFSFTTIDTGSNGQQQVVSAASPDLTAKVALYDLAEDPNNPAISATGTFIWAIQGTTGLYVIDATYPEAGEWGAEFTTIKNGQTLDTTRVRFDVQATGVMPAIGDRVPSVKTPTAADVGGDIAKIATDPSPDPAFYQVSEDQALAQHKPFVLIFATPAFCTSRICGPTLDKVKAVAAQYPGMTFINVEPYKLQYVNGHLQPVLDANGQLQPTNVTDAFNLLSEPWIFVVDSNGIIRGSFEAVATPDELKAAIDAVKGA
jgi:hypothetical protein